MVMNAQLLALASLPFLCAEDTSAVLSSSSSLIINQQVSLLQVLLQQQRRLHSFDSGGRPRPEQGGERITAEFLLSLSNRECVWRFRFSALQILELVDALDIPDPFRTCNRYSFTAIEALGLLLARFRSGLDLFDLCSRYDRCQSSLSELINELTEFVDERWKHLLDCDRDHTLHPEQLLKYAAAITAHGAPLYNCVAFLNCTIRKTCRPVIGQESVFNGSKRSRSLKYQTLTIPNGLIVHIYGPFEGRRNDNHLLVTNEILDKFAEFAFRPDLPVDSPAQHRNFIIFGDPAYGYGPHLASPFAKDDISDEEKAWNLEMSQVMIEVEHGLGVIVSLWPFLDIFRNMQVLSSPVGRYYRVGVLLSNALNCLQPNQIAQAFDLLPPTLQEYFHD